MCSWFSSWAAGLKDIAEIVQYRGSMKNIFLMSTLTIWKAEFVPAETVAAGRCSNILRIIVCVGRSWCLKQAVREKRCYQVRISASLSRERWEWRNFSDPNPYKFGKCNCCLTSNIYYYKYLRKFLAAKAQLNVSVEQIDADLHPRSNYGWFSQLGFQWL